MLSALEPPYRKDSIWGSRRFVAEPGGAADNTAPAAAAPRRCSGVEGRLKTAEAREERAASYGPDRVAAGGGEWACRGASDLGGPGRITALLLFLPPAPVGDCSRTVRALAHYSQRSARSAGAAGHLGTAGCGPTS
ncbi:hypothetical protein NDU88_002613 [Pleurodeles waltl]|uniref:Uncharacterized protein n=1 Tax=Pleurodeles waltl TaxID=8319 RepID=A0AAV7UBC9_PLEWA|nr:hypothetical protein NDU88_002613 [Pleurodeles waltl]